MKKLLDEKTIQDKVQEFGKQITQDFSDKLVEGKPLIVICVLKGSFMFFADLIRAIDLPICCEFFGISSYGNKMTSSGEVRITLDINEPLEDRHVLIVEDIVDTGLSMGFMHETFRARKPATLKTCTLLFKPSQLKREVDLDYVGFEVGNEFVVGYGIDYAGKYRQLPYVGVIENES